jgi:hypothetical protein
MSTRPVDDPCTVVLCKYQPELLVELLDRDAEVLLVLDSVGRLYESPDEALLAQCRQVYNISSFDSVSELAAVAVEIRSAYPKVSRVLNQNELSQFGAGYLRMLLGLAEDPLHHVSHRDKRLMKQLVREAGVCTAEFRSLPNAADPAAVAEVANQLSAPLIVKPAAGFGTITTVRVDDVSTLGTVAASLTFDTAHRSRHLIVEEYVPGEELCVDAIWSGGKALTFVAHRYLRPRITIMENALDGSVILMPEQHPELYERLRELHDRFNPVLGIEDGPTHLEVFERPDGELVFSEIATRWGGAWIQHMIGAYHGHSTWSLVIDAALTGRVPPLEQARPQLGGINIRPRTHGVVTALPTDEQLRAFPGMLSWHWYRQLEIGQKTRQSGPSDWFLFLILGADSAEEIEPLCIEAARTFSIETVALVDHA